MTQKNKTFHAIAEERLAQLGYDNVGSRRGVFIKRGKTTYGVVLKNKATISDGQFKGFPTTCCALFISADGDITAPLYPEDFREMKEVV